MRVIHSSDGDQREVKPTRDNTQWDIEEGWIQYHLNTHEFILLEDVEPFLLSVMVSRVAA